MFVFSRSDLPEVHKKGGKGGRIDSIRLESTVLQSNRLAESRFAPLREKGNRREPSLFLKSLYEKEMNLPRSVHRKRRKGGRIDSIRLESTVLQSNRLTESRFAPLREKGNRTFLVLKAFLKSLHEKGTRTYLFQVIKTFSFSISSAKPFSKGSAIIVILFLEKRKNKRQIRTTTFHLIVPISMEEKQNLTSCLVFLQNISGMKSQRLFHRMPLQDQQP